MASNPKMEYQVFFAFSKRTLQSLSCWLCPYLKIFGVVVMPLSLKNLLLSGHFSARQAQREVVKSRMGLTSSPVGKVRILDFYHFPLSLSG